ncbi:MAG: CHAD domain-containing protein, partial [Actinomycetota bacterium]|nr:CHAD domain-containing protein [Actinomycetota bacterium]
MIDEHRERESKFSVGSGWVLPDLSGVMPQATVEVAQIRLISEYYDTDDKALLAFGATLRRRTGDGETGWQLKLPAGKARIELHVRLTGGAVRVPKELSVLVTGIAAGARLRRLVTIRTDRTAHRWCTTAGDLLVEIADDSVRAESPGEAMTIVEWREIEAELGPVGNGTLSDQIAGVLTAAGADRGSYPNKVAHAVGEPTPGPSTGKQTAGSIALDYLMRHHHRLLNGDVKLRRGQDAVHKTRVATRRLRSAIRVFSKLFDP